ncbi:hypothetical protein F1542_14810 [Komagataeibacter sp. FXV3]|nr:hypothetical protein [Komagataeibacter sp. FXV3]
MWVTRKIPSAADLRGNQQKFLVKLFPKKLQETPPLKKRRHPATSVFYQCAEPCPCCTSRG